MQKNTTNKDDNEIDLIKLILVIWKGRKTVIRTVLICGFLGLFVAIFSPKVYTASTVLVPQLSSDNSSSNLGGLAALAGINLNKGDSKYLHPNLYPKIVQSVPFKRALLQVPLKFSDIDKEVTYKEYYEKHQKFNLLGAVKAYTIGLPGKVIGLFKNKTKEDSFLSVDSISKDSIYRISQEEKILFNSIQGQLGIEINPKEGYVGISFSMPEGLPAAQMTNKVRDLLQKAIIKFKIQKLQSQYNFIEQRYEEVKNDFLKKQAVLASFRDRNKGLVLSRSQSRLEQLQAEYNLSFSLYSDLAKQLENQKIKIKENTPVFTVVEPVSVPLDKSKPKRVIILALWIIIGFILGSSLVFFRNWINNSKISFNS